MGGKRKTNSFHFLLHEQARSVWKKKIPINPAFLTYHTLSSLLVVLLIVSRWAHVSYSLRWLRDAIRANPIRLRGEAADPAWEPSKTNLLPKHHKSCPVKWLFLMLLKRAEINIRFVMYCPLNYQWAQFTHDIHLGQPWSKVGSWDLQRTSDGAGGWLSDGFIYCSRRRRRRLQNLGSFICQINRDHQNKAEQSLFSRILKSGLLSKALK